MPPKKEQDLSSLPDFDSLTVLLVLALDDQRKQEIYQSLSSPLSIQKNLTVKKCLDLLKEKGIVVEPKKDPKDKDAKKEQQPVATTFKEKEVEIEQMISTIGLEILINNLQSMVNEVVVEARREKKVLMDPKSASPSKKEPKKQAKKDAKKEETIVEDTIAEEKKYEMAGDGYVFILDIPRSAEEVIRIIQSVHVDVVLVIESTNSRGEPNYSLLNETNLSELEIRSSIENHISTHQNKPVQPQQLSMKQVTSLIKASQSHQSIDNPMRNLVVKRLVYVYDSSKKEESLQKFKDDLFITLGRFSQDKLAFAEWSKTIQRCPMIKPIEVVERVIQKVEPKDEKKGIKKDTKKEEKEEVVETVKYLRYQDQPGNIKSQLKHYKETVGDSQELKIQDISEALVKGIVQEKCSESEQLETLISEKEIQNIFENARAEKETTAPNHSRKQPSLFLHEVLSLLPDKVSTQIDLPVSQFCHYSHCDPKYLTRIMHLFVFQKLQKERTKYRDITFTDRIYDERISSSHFLGLLAQFEQRHCQQVVTQIEGLDTYLLLVYHENPPGRNLYHTDNNEWRVTPNLENWIQLFKGEDSKAVGKMLDYDCKDVGGIGTRLRLMMPSDNSVMVEKRTQVGEKDVKEVKVLKNDSSFGLKGREKIEFWASIEDYLQVSVKDSDKKQNHSHPDPALETNPNQQVPTNNRNSQEIWIRGKDFIYKIDEFVTFYSQHAFQVKRKIGTSGEVIRYYRDKSIYITYPSGNTSTYKGGAWTRILNNFQIQKDSTKPLLLNTIKQGQITVEIRSDGTIFIKAKSYTKLIFLDSTVTLVDNERNTVTVTYKNYPTVRIRVDPHLISNENVIGVGSSYAYLGESNIFERSYNGRVVEVLSTHFSLYRYQEKTHEKPINVSLLYLREGSVVKITDQEILYLANDDYKQLNKVGDIQYWLQLFTPKENRRQGIYTLNRELGTIITTDSEGNIFTLSMEEPSTLRTAVSLNINNEAEEEPPSTNGYFVRQENYFLPTPTNFIHPRLFSIQGQEVKEYLNEEQLGDFLSKRELFGYQTIEEDIGRGRTSIQVFKKQDQKPLKPIIHKHSIQLEERTISIECLKGAPSTLLLPQPSFSPSYTYRFFIKQFHFSDYNDYLAMVSKYKQTIQERKHLRDVTYRVLAKHQLL